MTMRIGIVGNNLYGQVYFRALQNFPAVEIVGMCPELDESLEPFTSQQGIPPYSSFHSMLNEARMDAVILASITSAHYSQAMQSMAAGAHVLIDRPMARSISECDQLIEQADRTRRRLMVGHVLQFWPEYVTMRNLIVTQTLGIVSTATGWRISGTLNPAWQNRLLNADYGLGCLEAHIHDIEFFTFLFGKPGSVFAQGSKTRDGAWAQIHSLLRYPNRLQVALEANYKVPLNYPLSMHTRIDGSKGTAVFNFQGALATQGSAQRSLMLFIKGQDPEIVHVEVLDAYRGLVEHFLDCVTTNQNPVYGSPIHSRGALEVILALSRSAETGEYILL
jgi:UDP-N-acetylglucosamine 3-dehydrogenase